MQAVLSRPAARRRRGEAEARIHLHPAIRAQGRAEAWAAPGGARARAAWRELTDAGAVDALQAVVSPGRTPYYITV